MIHPISIPPYGTEGTQEALKETLGTGLAGLEIIESQYSGLCGSLFYSPDLLLLLLFLLLLLPAAFFFYICHQCAAVMHAPCAQIMPEQTLSVSLPTSWAGAAALARLGLATPQGWPGSRSVCSPHYHETPIRTTRQFAASDIIGSPPFACLPCLPACSMLLYCLDAHATLSA